MQIFISNKLENQQNTNEKDGDFYEKDRNEKFDLYSTVTA